MSFLSFLFSLYFFFHFPLCFPFFGFLPLLSIKVIASEPDDVALRNSKKDAGQSTYPSLRNPVVGKTLFNLKDVKDYIYLQSYVKVGVVVDPAYPLLNTQDKHSIQLA